LQFNLILIQEEGEETEGEEVEEIEEEEVLEERKEEGLEILQSTLTTSRNKIGASDVVEFVCQSTDNMH
jgi:hypothetical protein